MAGSTSEKPITEITAPTVKLLESINNDVYRASYTIVKGQLFAKSKSAIRL